MMKDDGVTSGGHGVWVGPGCSGVFIGNKAHGNARDGFHFAAGSVVKLHRNESFGNGRDGFHFGSARTYLAAQILALPQSERERLKRLLGTAKDDSHKLRVLKGNAKAWAFVQGALNAGASVATIADLIIRLAVQR